MSYPEAVDQYYIRSIQYVYPLTVIYSNGNISKTYEFARESNRLKTIEELKKDDYTASRIKEYILEERKNIVELDDASYFAYRINKELNRGFHFIKRGSFDTGSC
jgi:hypothetical protein